MESKPIHHKEHVIVPLASMSVPGYAASAFVTSPTGKRSAFGILAYFASEKAALKFAIAYAKARIDGEVVPKPSFTRNERL
ncbi:hypothetical protein [Paraburkholderia sp. MM5477-R1]|uniref:hypothetical protein n=1 Tax=Paraburkholderia sp. MM5477-R1 TaxID=2991062 RepID=UPI003D205B65